MGLASVVRSVQSADAGADHTRFRQWATRAAKTDRGNVALRLVAAQLCLASREPREATDILQQTETCTSWESNFIEGFLDLLAGRAPSSDVPEPPRDTKPQLIEASRWLAAAKAFGDDTPEEGYRIIGELLRERGESPMVILPLWQCLPAFDLPERQGDAPAAELIEALRGVTHKVRVPVEQANLARWAAAVGECDLACRLWDETEDGEESDCELYREDYAHLLCHLAVRAAKSGEPLQAVAGLRQAASIVDRIGDSKRVNSDRLKRLARQLERDTLTARLLARLFPEANGALGTACRYGFLATPIDDCADLSRALSANRPQAIDDAWEHALDEHASDARFLHGLAVVYWEQALANHARGRPQEDQWIRSTLLWALLLCTDEFWMDFLNQPEPDSREGEHDPGSKLLKVAIQNTLSLHSTIGQRHLAAGHIEEARPHAHCLDICRSDGDRMRETLMNHGVPFHLSLDPNRLEQVSRIAEDLLDDWCAKLVREAERETEDANAIQSLPEGIRKNYEGGISHLEPFVELGAPNVRLLHRALAWYNDWCYDLYVTRKVDFIRELIGPAGRLADMLAPHCARERGHAPENQALSQHYLLRGFAATDPEQKVEDYRNSLDWNSANDNAADLLNEAVVELFGSRLDKAIQLADDGRFNEAYEAIDLVEAEGCGHPQSATVERMHNEARQVRAVVSFRHSQRLADEGHFGQALAKAKDALRFASGEPAIQRFVEEMESLAPEEGMLRLMRVARQNLEQERHAAAIRLLSRVQDSSQFYEKAQQQLGGIYFRRGILASEKDPPDRKSAMRDFRTCLELIKDPAERKMVARRLSGDLNRQAVELIEQSQQFATAAQRIMDTVEGRK